MFSCSQSIQRVFSQRHDADLHQLWIKPYMSEPHCISCFPALCLQVIIHPRLARGVCLLHNNFKGRLGNCLMENAQCTCSWPVYSLLCVPFTLSADHYCDRKSCLGHAVKVHRGIWACSCSSTVLRGQWLTNKKHFSPQVAFSSLSVTHCGGK